MELIYRIKLPSTRGEIVELNGIKEAGVLETDTLKFNLNTAKIPELVAAGLIHRFFSPNTQTVYYMPLFRFVRTGKEIEVKPITKR